MSAEEITRLVEQAQGGDGPAYGELVRHFQGTVYGLALGRLGNHADAQDLTQEVFLHSLSRIRQVRVPAHFAAWLRQVTLRRAVNYLTRRRRPEPLAALPEPAAPEVDPAQELMRAERSAALRRCLDRLRPLDREALQAFYLRGRSLKQMAGDLAVPLGTVKRRLYTARNRLRAELEQAGLDN